MIVIKKGDRDFYGNRVWSIRTLSSKDEITIEEICIYKIDSIELSHIGGYSNNIVICSSGIRYTIDCTNVEEVYRKMTHNENRDQKIETILG